MRRIRSSHNDFFILILFSIFGTLGCSVSKNRSAILSNQNLTINQEVKSSLKSVAGSLAGHELKEQEFNDISRKIQNDKETQTAIQSVTDALSGQTKVVKYCPIDGKRFSEKFEKCPEHGVTLKEIRD